MKFTLSLLFLTLGSGLLMAATPATPDSLSIPETQALTLQVDKTKVESIYNRAQAVQARLNDLNNQKEALTGVYQQIVSEFNAAKDAEAAKEADIFEQLHADSKKYQISLDEKDITKSKLVPMPAQPATAAPAKK